MTWRRMSQGLLVCGALCQIVIAHQKTKNDQWIVFREMAIVGSAYTFLRLCPTDPNDMAYLHVGAELNDTVTKEV